MSKKSKKERKLSHSFNRKMDKVWSLTVRMRANFKCEMCGQTPTPRALAAAHILPREITEFRWDPNNGLALCSRCHVYSPTSFHQNPLFFVDWLQKNRPLIYQYLMNNLHNDVEERQTQ
jgi:hypothetical protein